MLGFVQAQQAIPYEDQRYSHSSCYSSAEGRWDDQQESEPIQVVGEEANESATTPLMMFGFGNYGARGTVQEHHFNERNYDGRDNDEDFTKTFLNWRLGSIRTPLEEASSVSPLETRYDRSDVYYDKFLPLILEEARAATEQGLAEQNKSFTVKIKKNVTQPNTLGNPWIMELEGAIPSDQEHSAVMNVLLLEHQDGMKFLVIANQVGEQEQRTLKAKFQLSWRTVQGNQAIFNKGATWKATYLASLVTHERAYEACSKKVSSQCLLKIRSSQITNPIPVNDPSVAAYIQHLNESQQRAIQSVVAAPQNSVTIIQGPPGTGKTTTIIGLLRALCSKHERALVCAPSNKAIQVLAERFLKDYPELPIILAGIESKLSDELRPIFLHTWRSDLRRTFLKNLDDVLLKLNPPVPNPIESNEPQAQQKKAVRKFNKNQFLEVLEKTIQDLDIVHQQLKKYQFKYTGNFLNSAGVSIEKSFFRILQKHLTKLKEQTQPIDFNQENSWDAFQQRVAESKRKLEKYKADALVKLPAFTDNDEEIEKKLIKQSQVVCATLSVTGRRSMLGLPSDVMPKTLIVDEAGQSVEAETLIAFQHCPSKVVLAGDTKQLPATTISSLAKEKKYDRSMMARLEECNQPTLMLETQYRMDPQICHWPSSQYYAGRLLPHDSIVRNTSTDLMQPKAFYNIASGKESNGGGSTSKMNESEADYIVQIIRKIRETDSTSNIGVITFYAAQVEKIQELLNQRDNRNLKKDVTVSTVDGFQGGERDIILVSCVRAKKQNNNENQIGFLKDERRLNVAITRAKRTLIILGHEKTLVSKETDVKKLISNLKGRNKFFTEQQLNQFLGNEIAVPQSLKDKAGAKNKNREAVAAPPSASSKGQQKKLKETAVKKRGEQMSSELAPRIEQIRNPDAYYTDEDMTDLGPMLLPRDIHYIPPTVAMIPSQLAQAMDDFISNSEKKKAVIVTHMENHFTGILINRNNDNTFSVIHFDPVGFSPNGQPMHEIPANISEVLKAKFPDSIINHINNRMQTYTVTGQGKKKINVIDNCHCGPFVLYVMTEMAKGSLRLAPDKPKRLQVKLTNKHRWQNVPLLDQNQSNNFGRSIREYHEAILSGNHELEENSGIRILRNLIQEEPSHASLTASTTPLETMSDLENALPIPPTQPPKNSKKSSSFK